MGLSSLSLKPKFTHPLLNPGGTKFRQKRLEILKISFSRCKNGLMNCHRRHKNENPKFNQLQEMIERLETGLSNMESENQVIR